MLVVQVETTELFGDLLVSLVGVAKKKSNILILRLLVYLGRVFIIRYSAVDRV